MILIGFQVPKLYFLIRETGYFQKDFLPISKKMWPIFKVEAMVKKSAEL